jgi:glycosyltransferase involved in cell wall biosynthesis
MSKSTIVIPCYNEASRLNAQAFGDFVRDHADVRFLFVDDGSTDRTIDVLRQLAAQNADQLRVHAMPRNAGKAEAVRHGLLEASRNGSTFVGFWDADLATPLDEIPPMLAILENRPTVEMAFASRVNLLGRSVRRNLLRHYIGRVFATTAAGVLGVGIYDTQCGAKLFRVSDGFVARLQEPFIGGWIFDVEMIAREIQARRGTSLPPVREIIVEHPLMTWRDVAGSKIRLGDWFVVGANLIRIYWKYLRR